MAAPRTVGDILDDLPPIGHNNPPPLVTIGERIDALYETVAVMPTIVNEDQARDVAETIAELRRAEAEAEAAHKVEKAPHLAAGRAVDAAWKPLSDKATKAKKAALAAQTVWLEAQEAERLKREDIARRAAETLADAARKAHAAANPADLDATEAAEKALRQAADAERALKAVASERPVAKGYGGAKGIGLRSSWLAEVHDPLAFGKWLWTNRNPEYLAWLAECAIREVAACKQDLPGVKAREEKRAA